MKIKDMINMDRFYFFSKSADKFPGKGVNEFLNSDKSYKKLSQIKDWRKVLSNFYEFPIKIDGLTFLTVEHYYQGSKFRKENPEFYRQFSLESGSDISKDSTMAKSAGGKTGKYKGKQLRPSRIKMDSDFDRARGHTEMELALLAKFSIDGLPQNVLMATGDAELWHGTRGVPPFRQVAHEKIRDQIRLEK